ncbi:hypothetical protein A2U01_0098794, partial [Trifolium medium]|nr:hypothetical protein [Trifolium medium]
MRLRGAAVTKKKERNSAVRAADGLSEGGGMVKLLAHGSIVGCRR